MKEILLVGLGGFAGSVVRYLVSKLNVTWQVLSIPMGTLTVNVLGSLLIGILVGLSTKTGFISAELRLLLMVGFCGGFTTFSSFTNENLLLLQNGQYLSLVLYTTGSLILGFLAVYLGYLIGS